MVLSDQIILEIGLEMQELIVERDMMIAENNYAIMLEKRPKYRENEFKLLKSKFKKLRNNLIMMGKK